MNGSTHRSCTKNEQNSSSKLRRKPADEVMRTPNLAVVRASSLAAGFGEGCQDAKFNQVLSDTIIQPRSGKRQNLQKSIGVVDLTWGLAPRRRVRGAPSHPRDQHGAEESNGASGGRKESNWPKEWPGATSSVLAPSSKARSH